MGFGKQSFATWHGALGWGLLIVEDSRLMITDLAESGMRRLRIAYQACDMELERLLDFSSS